MGRSKPLLDFGGVPVLRRVVDAAAGAGVPRSVVVLGGGADEERIRGLEFGGHPVTWVTNPAHGSPQLTSLQCALRELPEGSEWFSFQPVDFPLVAAADYRLLLDATREPGDETVFFLSHARRRGHPVLCARCVGDKLLSLGPEDSARDVLKRESSRYVLTPNAGVLEDMDTPEDYERLLRLL